jgi:hypothetical protein
MQPINYLDLLNLPKVTKASNKKARPRRALIYLSG